MTAGKGINDLLKAKGIEPGDSIEISTRDGGTLRGVLMPHHEFSGSDIVMLKLDTGYNIGTTVGSPDSVKLISKPERRDGQSSKMIAASGNSSGELPRISIVSTGGTIASYVDYRTGAVKPAISADELAGSVPELASICTPRPEVLYSILSENMRPEIWTKLAEKVAEHLNGGSVGCIVPHGTDTMGFSAAALSFSLSNLTGPVVLVGSQRSSDRPSSDSKINLLSAARLCLESDLAEVVVLMHEKTDDGACAVHRGTRVRKCHSSRRDAFESVNETPLGFVDETKVLIEREHAKRQSGKVEVDARFEPDIALIQFYPGFSIDRFEKCVEGAKGVVIAGTGLGHVHQDAIPIIGRLSRSGIPVCVTTQCIWGSVNLNVYSTGRDMLTAGAIPLDDMLTETAYVKLSWVLARESDPAKVAQIMRKSLRGELSDRRPL